MSGPCCWPRRPRVPPLSGSVPDACWSGDDVDYDDYDDVDDDDHDHDDDVDDDDDNDDDEAWVGFTANN